MTAQFVVITYTTRVAWDGFVFLFLLLAICLCDSLTTTSINHERCEP